MTKSLHFHNEIHIIKSMILHKNAEISDVERLVELESRSLHVLTRYQKRFSADWWREEVTGGRVRCVVDEHDTLLGAVAFKTEDCQSSKIGKIELLLVDPDVQGRGIGREILRTTVDAFRNAVTGVALDVSVDNHRARRLYEKMGFQDETETQNQCYLRERFRFLVYKF